MKLYFHEAAVLEIADSVQWYEENANGRGNICTAR